MSPKSTTWEGKNKRERDLARNPPPGRGGALFLALDNKSGEQFTRRVSGRLTVTLQGLEAGVVLWVIEPVIDTSRVGNIPSPRTMGTFA